MDARVEIVKVHDNIREQNTTFTNILDSYWVIPKRSITKQRGNFCHAGRRTSC